MRAPSPSPSECSRLSSHFDEEGGDFAKNPIGTGPYKLGDFRVGERCQLLRRTEKPYWRGPIYLDEIIYVDQGDDPQAWVAALASGQVDHIYDHLLEDVRGCCKPHVNTKICEDTKYS